MVSLCSPCRFVIGLNPCRLCAFVCVVVKGGVLLGCIMIGWLRDCDGVFVVLARFCLGVSFVLFGSSRLRLVPLNAVSCVVAEWTELGRDGGCG